MNVMCRVVEANGVEKTCLLSKCSRSVIVFRKMLQRQARRIYFLGLRGKLMDVL